MHFHIAVVQRQQRNQRNVQEKCVAHVYFLFCLINLAFLTFTLPPPPLSLLRLPIDFGGGRRGTQGEGIDTSTMQKGANL